jgi:hypothetical protein
MFQFIGFLIVIGAMIAFPPLGFVVLFFIGLALLGGE